MKQRVGLLQRMNRWGALVELSTQLRQEQHDPTRLGDLSALLSEAAASIGEVAARSSIEDTVLHLASVAFGAFAGQSVPVTQITNSIRRLYPNDGLLGRDLIRLRSNLSAPLPAPPSYKPNTSLVCVNSGMLRLPQVGQWFHARGDVHGLHALARNVKPSLTYARMSWENVCRVATFDDPAPALGTVITMTEHGTDIVIARSLHPAIAQTSLSTDDARGLREYTVGTPPWLSRDVVTTASTGSTLWAVRVVGSQIVLDAYSNGTVTYTRDVTSELVAAGATGGGTALTLDVNGAMGTVALAYGQHLLLLKEQQQLHVVDIGSRVFRLVGTPGEMPGWVVLLEKGAVYVEARTHRITELDTQLDSPHAALLGSGELLLASTAVGYLFHLPSRRAQPLGRLDLKTPDWIVLMRGQKKNEFALLTTTGEVQRWVVKQS